MSYRVYTTEGIVLDAVPAGESNQYLWIYTRRLGRVGVRAKSLRKLESKLRFGLQPYSLVEVSLVHGKSGWRLVGARPLTNFYFSLRSSERGVLVSVVGLVRRLVHGQKQNTYLYESIENALRYLQSRDITGDDRHHLERLTVLRILHALGYLKGLPAFSPFTKDTLISSDRLAQFRPVSDQALKAINQALTHVHL